jgi:hypothetical protein
MAVQAARLPRRAGRGGGGGSGRGRTGRGGRAARGMGFGLRLPLWWVIAGVVVLLLALGGGGYLFYRSLDSLYPQALGKYFRPETPLASGSILYRTTEGQLFIAPVADTGQAKRLLDSGTGVGTTEYVRDATVLPGGKNVVYYATLRGGPAESDHVKVVGLNGPNGAGSGISRDVTLTPAAGEKLYPTVFASTSGRYVAVLSQDRGRAYYLDTTDGSVRVGTPDAPPEGMLWNRNGDLRSPALGGQRPFATSPDGKLRAQVRDGARRAPECDEAKCEAVQELIVASGTVAGSQQPPVVLYGAFSQFSAEGWGPIPTQPAQRFYGRLVWSPDAQQVLFSTLYEADTQTYAIAVDGKTRPRLVLDRGEVLDWLP